jgi:hypothetical protein
MLLRQTKKQEKKKEKSQQQEQTSVERGNGARDKNSKKKF